MSTQERRTRTRSRSKSRSKKTVWEKEDEILQAQEDRYIVEEILDKTYNEELKQYYYYVKWEGFQATANTWEPEYTLLEDVPDMVIDYNDKLDECLYNSKSAPLPKRVIKESEKKKELIQPSGK